MDEWDRMVEVLEKYLAEGRRTIPIVLVRPLIKKLRYYQNRNSVYLDAIVEIIQKYRKENAS